MNNNNNDQLSDLSEGSYQLQQMMIEEHVELLKAERQYQDLEVRIWTTKEGERVSVSRMKSGHVRNCIRFLQRLSTIPLWQKWIVVFEDELSNRRELKERLMAELCTPQEYRIFTLNMF